nr:PREDICTED: muscle M-line assembly protein unc-89-like [Lepisosteus oculatus]
MHIHTSNLEINNVQERDSGSYRVFAINSEGSAESTASLLVALKEEQNANYLSFVKRSEKTHERIDSLVEKRREIKFKIDLRCVGSPFDKKYIAKGSSRGASPKHGLMRTMYFRSSSPTKKQDWQLSEAASDRSSPHLSEKLSDTESLLDEDVKVKLHLLKRAVKERKRLSLSSRSSSEFDLESVGSESSHTDYFERLRLKPVSLPDLQHYVRTPDQGESLISKSTADIHGRMERIIGLAPDVKESPQPSEETSFKESKAIKTLKEKFLNEGDSEDHNHTQKNEQIERDISQGIIYEETTLRNLAVSKDQSFQLNIRQWQEDMLSSQEEAELVPDLNKTENTTNMTEADLAAEKNVAIYASELSPAYESASENHDKTEKNEWIEENVSQEVICKEPAQRKLAKSKDQSFTLSIKQCQEDMPASQEEAELVSDLNETENTTNIIEAGLATEKEPSINVTGLSPAYLKNELELHSNKTMGTAMIPSKTGKEANYFMRKWQPFSPFFEKEISHLEVTEGEMCTLECHFQGHPQPTVTWYKDERPIPQHVDYDINTTETQSKLTICYPTSEHQGVYTCVIFNQYGTATSSATLKIVKDYVNKKQPMVTCEFKVTEEAEMTEEQLDRMIEDELKSYVDTNDEFKSTLQVPQVVLSRPRPSDTSLFSSPVEIMITAPTPIPEQNEDAKDLREPSDKTSDVSAKDNQSQTTKHKFTFSFDVVTEPPQVISDLESIQCREGDTIMLECLLSGDPAPVVTWLHNDRSLSTARSKYKFEEHEKIYRMYIDDVSQLDAGTYKCIAKNKLGKAESISNVTVEPSLCQWNEETEMSAQQYKTLYDRLAGDNEVRKTKSLIAEGPETLGIPKFENDQPTVEEGHHEFLFIPVTNSKSWRMPAVESYHMDHKNSAFLKKQTEDVRCSEKTAELPFVSVVDTKKFTQTDTTEATNPQSENVAKRRHFREQASRDMPELSGCGLTSCGTVTRVSKIKQMFESPIQQHSADTRKECLDLYFPEEQAPNSVLGKVRDLERGRRKDVSKHQEVPSQSLIQQRKEEIAAETKKVSLSDEPLELFSHDFTSSFTDSGEQRFAKLVPVQPVPHRFSHPLKEIVTVNQKEANVLVLPKEHKLEAECFIHNLRSMVPPETKDVIASVSSVPSETKDVFSSDSAKTSAPISFIQQSRDASTERTDTVESHFISLAHLNEFETISKDYEIPKLVKPEAILPVMCQKEIIPKNQDKPIKRNILKLPNEDEFERKIDGTSWKSDINFVPLERSPTLSYEHQLKHVETNTAGDGKMEEEQHQPPVLEVVPQIPVFSSVYSESSKEDVVKSKQNLISLTAPELLGMETDFCSLSDYFHSFTDGTNQKIMPENEQSEKSDLSKTTELKNKGEAQSGVKEVVEEYKCQEPKNKIQSMEEPLKHEAVSLKMSKPICETPKVHEDNTFSLTDYLISVAQQEKSVTKTDNAKEKVYHEPGVSSLEEEEVTFKAVYDYYNQQPEWIRSLSPESEMSIEMSSTCSDEIAELEKFYTPPSSAENSQLQKSPDSFHTPCGTPEGYVTPPQCSFSAIESNRPSNGTVLDRLFSPPKIFRSPEDEGIETTPLTFSLEEGSSTTEGRSSGAFGTLQDMEPKPQGIPPAFIKPITKKSVFETEALVFCAELTGIPSPEVKWYQNKIQLKTDHRTKMERDGDVCTLEIQSVSKADEGEYICNAVNGFGEAKSITQVEVISLEAKLMPTSPAVTHQHVIEFDVEDDATSRSPSPQEILLEVELDENEVKEFEKQVKIITIPEYTPDNKSMIISLDVLPCLFDENTVDFITQESDELKIAFEVTEMPPRFINPIFDMETPENTDAVFECSVTGMPAPTVAWFKDSVRIPQGDRKYIFSSENNSHYLKIKNVCCYDSGIYSCQAVNQVGETICRASLVVLDTHTYFGKARGKEITAISLGSAKEQPQKFDLLVGNSMVQGDQTSEIELEFEFEHETDESQKALRLVAVTDHEHKEQGEKCVNINFDVFAESSKEDMIEFKAKESDTCSFQFQVTESPPKCLVPLKSITAALGTSVVLQCLVTGTPRPTAEWYKDGKAIKKDRYIIQEKASGSFNLIIMNVNKADAGEFKCIVRNTAGSTETVCLLKVF